MVGKETFSHGQVCRKRWYRQSQAFRSRERHVRQRGARLGGTYLEELRVIRAVLARFRS